jgi:hypothetical protein
MIGAGLLCFIGLGPNPRLGPECGLRVRRFCVGTHSCVSEVNTTAGLVLRVSGAGAGAGMDLLDGEEEEEEDDLARLEHQRARIIAAQKRVAEGKTAQEEAPPSTTGMLCGLWVVGCGLWVVSCVGCGEL